MTFHDPTRGGEDRRGRVAMDGVEKRFRVPHTTVVNLPITGTRTTASTSYADCFTTDLLQTSFEKYLAETKLVVTVHGQTSSNSATEQVVFGVQANGTDTQIVKFDHDTVGDKFAWSGAVQIADVPKGTYTIKGRWKVSDGVGTITTDSLDQWSMVVTETY